MKFAYNFLVLFMFSGHHGYGFKINWIAFSFAIL